jgi:hypothetical protein
VAAMTLVQFFGLEVPAEGSFNFRSRKPFFDVMVRRTRKRRRRGLRWRGSDSVFTIDLLNARSKFRELLLKIAHSPFLC